PRRRMEANEMKRLHLTPLLAVALLLDCSSIYAQDASGKSAPAAATPTATSSPTCASPTGTWINQMGSEMVIKSVDTTTGAITGQYRTSTGASGWYPLVGWANSLPAAPPADNAKVISFSVNWGSVGSVTSWTGICRGTNELRTLWQLGR